MSICPSCGGQRSSLQNECPNCKTKKSLEAISEQAKLHAEESSRQGKDLANRLDSMVEAQFASAEAVEEGLDNVADSLDRGFRMLEHQLSSQNVLLESINYNLSNPIAVKADELRKMADTLRTRELFPKAEQFYIDSLETNRLDYRAYIGYAIALAIQRKFTESKQQIVKSIVHAEEDDGGHELRCNSYSLLASVALAEGNIAEAHQNFAICVKFAPERTEEKYSLAVCAGKIGKSEEAVEALKSVIALEPEYFIRAKSSDFGLARKNIVASLKQIYSSCAEKTLNKFKELQEEIPNAVNAVSEAERARDRSYHNNEKLDSRTQCGELENKVNELGQTLGTSSIEYPALLSTQRQVTEARIYASDIITKAQTERQEYQKRRKDQQIDALKYIPDAVTKWPFAGGIAGGILGLPTGVLYSAFTKEESIGNVGSNIVNFMLYGAMAGAAAGLYYGIRRVVKKHMGKN